MAVSGFAKNYRAKMFSGAFPAWEQTDPEFAELFENFAFDEVIRQDDLDDRTRCMAILAALIGSQSIDAYNAFAGRFTSRNNACRGTGNCLSGGCLSWIGTSVSVSECD